MKPEPKTMRPMETAPRDGSVVDLWSPTYGWQRDIWWDDEGPEPGDGWITICPRPFVGWRKARAA